MTCPHSTIEDSRAGDVVCERCGLVIGDRIIDVRSEWRTFSDNAGGDDPSRIGGKLDPNLNGTDMLTEFSAPLDATAHRARVPTSESSVREGFSKIKTACARLGTGEALIQRAQTIFKDAYDKKLMRSRKHEAMIAAAIYKASCLIPAGNQRSLKEIRAVFTQLEKKEITKAANILTKHVDSAKPSEGAVRTSSAVDLLVRVASDLGFAYSERILAQRIAQNVESMSITSGRSPITICGGVAYLVLSLRPDKVPLQEIHKSSGAAPSTIIDVYKEIYPHRFNIFPADFDKSKIAALPNHGEKYRHDYQREMASEGLTVKAEIKVKTEPTQALKQSSIKSEPS